MDVIGNVLVNIVANGIKTKLGIGYNLAEICHPHPARNVRSGLQTVELPPEDYREIAQRVTEALQEKGHDITVVYDATDGLRAFVIAEK